MIYENETKAQDLITAKSESISLLNKFAFEMNETTVNDDKNKTEIKIKALS
jgi:hypothetical protein